MLIREVADPDTKKLAALSQFLLGRSKDEAAAKQISQQAFVDAANIWPKSPLKSEKKSKKPSSQ